MSNLFDRNRGSSSLLFGLFRIRLKPCSRFLPFCPAITLSRKSTAILKSRHAEADEALEFLPWRYFCNRISWLYKNIDCGIILLLKISKSPGYSFGYLIFGIRYSGRVTKANVYRAGNRRANTQSKYGKEALSK